MNAAEQKVISDVETFGWHVVLVSDDEEGPGFAFTIGLFRNYQHPEVIIFGIPHAVAHAVLNSVGEAVKAGTRLSSGDRKVEFLKDQTCAFVVFPRNSYEAYLGFARWFYKGNEFPALQCVWPDSNGHFPWEAAAAESTRSRQPVPGVVV